MILDTTHAIGWKANDFALQGIDGKTYSLAEVRGRLRAKSRRSAPQQK
jgi:peroxiredoxin